MLRLNKFIASSGLCSRRKADELIEQGKVKVNGETEFNGNSTLNGDNTTTGKITASDDVLGGGISLKDHSHDFNYIGAGQGSSQQSGTTEKPS